MRWINDKKVGCSHKDLKDAIGRSIQKFYTNEEARIAEIERREHIEHDATHAAQLKDTFLKYKAGIPNKSGVPFLQQVEELKVKSAPLEIVITPVRSVYNNSCRELYVIYNLAGVAKENISVSYGYYDKSSILVKCFQPTLLANGASVKFNDINLDLRKGEFMNFTLDISRGPVIFNNGMLMIPLKRDLELPKAPTLEILVK